MSAKDKIQPLIDAIGAAVEGEDLRDSIMEALEALAEGADEDEDVKTILERIQPYLSEIQVAVYGEEVRSSIINAMEILAEELDGRPAYDYDHYTGDYEVTPTISEQILDCIGMLMDENVVIHPIPSDYIKTDDADATAGEILSGKTAYVDGEKVTGSMPNRGTVEQYIDDVDDIIDISEGYHSGEGTVEIHPLEAGKIIPENIKKGVEILGVTGDYEPTMEPVTVKSTETSQVIEPEEGYDGFSEVTVSPMVYEEKVVKSTETQQEITPTAGKDAISKITVQAVELEEKTVKSTTSQQEVTPTAGKDGIKKVTVEPIILEDRTVKSSSSRQDILPTAGKDGIQKVIVEPISMQTKTAKSGTTAQDVEPDQGYDGLEKVTVQPISLQSKTATAGNSSQDVEPDTGYDGLSKVTVQPVNVQTKTATPSGVTQHITPDAGYVGLSDVEVEAIGYTETPNETGTTVTIGTPGASEVYNTLKALIERPFAEFDFDARDFDQIGYSTFNGHSYLRSLTAQSLKAIGSSAFNGCQRLESITGLNEIFLIKSNAFKNCTSLTRVNMKLKVKTAEDADITGGSNGRCVLSANSFTGCSSLTRIDLDASDISDLTKLEIDPDFLTGSGVTDIYVSWSSGDVSGAPWGVSGATIHYDTEF